MYQAQQLLTVQHVASMLCVSVSHVWAQAKDKADFHKSFKISAKQTRWKLSGLEAYIEAKSATQH